MRSSRDQGCGQPWHVPTHRAFHAGPVGVMHAAELSVVCSLLFLSSISLHQRIPILSAILATLKTEGGCINYSVYISLSSLVETDRTILAYYFTLFSKPLLSAFKVKDCVLGWVRASAHVTVPLEEAKLCRPN